MRDEKGRFVKGSQVRKGAKQSIISRKKMSNSKHEIFKNPENHPRWKGNKVGYRALHYWVVKKLGKPNECKQCGKTGDGHQMQWANLSRKYKRELSDWLRLCAKCHKIFDSKNKKNV